VSEAATRAARWAARRSRARRIFLIAAAVVVVGAFAIGTVVVVSGDGDSSAASQPDATAPRRASTTHAPTTAAPTTTSSTIPPLKQPRVVKLPDVPSDGLSWGDDGPVLAAYQKRLKKLHFDPGTIDGVYGRATDYAVVTVQKLLGLETDGRIGPMVKLGLENFKFAAAKPKAEANRVEINLDNQVLTVYKKWQPILITTTSTGSGEHFCGGVDGCQYAITPAGKYHFYYLHKGWDAGKLGKMWNPYYFNGGIAVHGLESVPDYPASHGCARIPMDIATYFPLLVDKGEAVYVVGTPKERGNGYVGPAPTTSTTVPKTTTTPPKKPGKPPKTTTTKPPKTTTTKPPKTTTTKPPTSTPTT
jgi:peptidoglycan hydrolase-like protein with peptidoglycan-binding domain